MQTQSREKHDQANNREPGARTATKEAVGTLARVTATKAMHVQAVSAQSAETRRASGRQITDGWQSLPSRAKRGIPGIPRLRGG
jgi:hypothetical protein